MKQLTSLIVSVCMVVMVTVRGRDMSRQDLLEDKKELNIPVSEDDNPCVYIGSYYTIDVRDVAEEIKGRNITDPNAPFYYFLSLCSPIPCGETEGDPHTAVACQYDHPWNKPLKLGVTASSEFHLVNLTYFYITYIHGDPTPRGDMRITQVNFHMNKDSTEKPTVEFDHTDTIGSDPATLKYMFTVHLK